MRGQNVTPAVHTSVVISCCLRDLSPIDKCDESAFIDQGRLHRNDGEP